MHGSDLNVSCGCLHSLNFYNANIKRRTGWLKVHRSKILSTLTNNDIPQINDSYIHIYIALYVFLQYGCSM